MTLPPDAAVPPEDPRNARIARLAGLFGRSREEAGLPPGDIAELRRMTPEGSLPPACWRLLVSLGVAGEAEVPPWAALIATMARAGTFGTMPVGCLLAAPADRTASYAEARFVRLLRADTLAKVVHEARLAAGWCAAHGGGLRFTDERGPNGFGPFILAAAAGHQAQAARRADAIARDYFVTQQRAAQAPED